MFMPDRTKLIAIIVIIPQKSVKLPEFLQAVFVIIVTSLYETVLRCY